MMNDYKEKMMDGYPEHEVERCLKTLTEAEEIKMDDKKMKAVKKLAGKKKKQIKSIEDIRSAHQDMMKSKDGY